MPAVVVVASSVDADPNIASRDGSSHYGLGVGVMNHASVSVRC